VSNKKKLTLRLTPKADALLRGNLTHKGDLSDALTKAITHTSDRELATLALAPRPSGRAGHGANRETYLNTSVVIDRNVYDRISLWASAREVSSMALIDALLIHYYGAKKRQTG
jgi:hypothetical protein